MEEEKTPDNREIGYRLLRFLCWLLFKNFPQSVFQNAEVSFECSFRA
jgi:hypothetical protein